MKVTDFVYLVSPAGVEHPQPLLPAAFASASLTQQASTPFGAGPPQQGVADVCVFFVALLLSCLTVLLLHPLILVMGTANIAEFPAVKTKKPDI
ncbi:hypothetical protein [Hoeflea sp. TYP-13]|uniref:hypothetical protein n=1 Tax=Hoeflea sp. TYP-13 TaxID=3230023 RepID=UPI0034C5DD0A